jgi:hypothetical protein
LSSIRCYFEVIGHGFDPHALTEALGVEPTKTWRTGEVTRQSGRPYKHDGWSIRSDEVDSLDLQEVALPMLKRLLPVAGPLVQFCEKLALEVQFSCAVYVEDDQMPAISLDRETVQMLCALGASLDVDVLNLGSAADGGPV